MSEVAFEIRICRACGLRYPLVAGQRFGVRCPACMGETRIALSRQLAIEPRRHLTQTYPARAAKMHPYYSERSVGVSEAGNGRVAVLLDNIRSAWNAGSILRSADGFGISQAYLCGITPTPDHEAVTKTSLGAEDSVPWSYHKDAVKLVKGLKKAGHSIYALEEHERAVDIHHASNMTYDSVLIVGNEIIGVDPELLDLSDGIFYIPMRGGKRSFNVAIAFGIAAFALSSK